MSPLRMPCLRHEMPDSADVPLYALSERQVVMRLISFCDLHTLPAAAQVFNQRRLAASCETSCAWHAGSGSSSRIQTPPTPLWHRL